MGGIRAKTGHEYGPPPILAERGRGPFSPADPKAPQRSARIALKIPIPVEQRPECPYVRHVCHQTFFRPGKLRASSAPPRRQSVPGTNTESLPPIPRPVATSESPFQRFGGSRPRVYRLFLGQCRCLNSWTLYRLAGAVSRSRSSTTKPAVPIPKWPRFWVSVWAPYTSTSAAFVFDALTLTRPL